MAEARGIVAGILRALKPLALGGAAAMVLLAGSLLWLELRQQPAHDSPQRLVLDAQETLLPGDVLFSETRPQPPYTQEGFTPLVIYEVALKDARQSFSHPISLNFLGEYRQGMALARKDHEGWIRLSGAEAGKQPSVALTIRVDKPGIYAMGRFDADE